MYYAVTLEVDKETESKIQWMIDKVVGLFIPDLIKGKEPRRSKHIPKQPKMLVFTRNFET